MLVALILGIFARLAMPDASPRANERLGLAAHRVADQVRLTRVRAMRGDEIHGLAFSTGPERLRAFRAADPTALATPTYDVRDPISKHLLDFEYLAVAGGAPLTLAAFTPSWSAACATPTSIAFDDRGMVRCPAAWAVHLVDLDIAIEVDGRVRTVSLDGVTGRVTIQ